MGLFGWLKKKDQVPDWAHGLDNKQFKALWGSALEWFSDHGVEVIADEKEGTIEAQSGFLQGSHFSLLNLARLAAKMKPDEVAATVKGFLQSQWDSTEEAALVKSHGYERASPQSRIRLFAVDPEMEPHSMAGKDVAPNLKAVICLDLSQSTVSVTMDELESWGVSLEDAFNQAMELTLQDFKDYFEDDLPLLAGKKYAFEVQESFFVSSVILCLPELFDHPPRFGILAGVPTRSVLLCTGLDDQVPKQEFEELNRLTTSVFNCKSGPVTPELYWLYEGEVLALSDGAVWERFSKIVLR